MPRTKWANNSNDAKIGDRIKSRRKMLGISQTALGEHLNVTFQQVQKYEKGMNRVSASTLEKIAEKLQTSVPVLMGITDKPVVDEIEKLCGMPGTLDLLKAFVRIKDQKLRNRTIALVEQMAE